MLSLADLVPGEIGKICGFRKGHKAYRQKLLAMGIAKGREGTLKRVAPAGDPVELVFGGSSVTLRKEEAAIIQIEKSNHE